MAPKAKTVGLVVAGVTLTAVLGYLVYYDYRRHHDPHLKRQIKRERKKAVKAAKLAEEKAKENVMKLIESVIEAANQEEYPTSPEAKEKYFMEQVTIGEALCGKGEAYYHQAVVPFYKALKIYPSPLELVMIYQKTVPEPVFQILINIMAIEQNKRQNEFYKQFPPKETNVALGELPAGKTEDGKPIIRRGLVADRDIAEGEVIYQESAFVSALHPDLEGQYCNYCMAKVTEENKIQCSNCDKVAFCSADCERAATEQYHQFLCTNNKLESAEENAVKKKELDFFNHAKEKNEKYPCMIARFLSSMVAEEIAKNKKEQERSTVQTKTPTYSAWDHIDRFRYLEISSSPEISREITMLKELLGSKVPGIEEFLSEEIYLTLKGRLTYNCYAVATNDPVEVQPSSERLRLTPEAEKASLGAALYKISTYIGHAKSDDQVNTKIEFRDGNQTITVVATKGIEKGQELIASYILPQPEEK